MKRSLRECIFRRWSTCLKTSWRWPSPASRAAIASWTTKNRRPTTWAQHMHSIRKLPRWRNGRRGGLKIRFPRGSGGSNPFLGTNINPVTMRIRNIQHSVDVQTMLDIGHKVVTNFLNGHAFDSDSLDVVWFSSVYEWTRSHWSASCLQLLLGQNLYPTHYSS